MNFCQSLPAQGWLRNCSIECTRPTVNEMVVFVIKKKYYDSYRCYCCQECFRKKIQVLKKEDYEIISKCRISTHLNSMLLRLL